MKICILFQYDRCGSTSTSFIADIKLAYYFNDRYLSTEDSEFVELVKADIDLFVQSDQLDL